MFQNDNVFAMSAPQFESMMARAKELQAALAKSATAKRAGTGYQRAGTVAVVDIVGPMTKYGGPWTDVFGGVSTLDTCGAIRAAVDDSTIEKIMLLIDSPGGQVAGAFDLADLVAEVNKKKPVFAFIEDMGASAAYLVASQARFIWCNASARVGGMGVYGVIRDFSKAYESAGVRTLVVKAGEFKGAGVPGTPVTDSQLVEVQREINAINELFVSAVARGRRLGVERVRMLADGRVHIGEHARAVGLVDAVASLDGVLVNLNERPERGTTGAGGYANAVTRYRALINAETARLMSLGKTEAVARSKAIAAVDKSHPGLRAEMVAQANPGRKAAPGATARPDSKAAHATAPDSK